jgi:Arc/MetJ-type ribon-helix-helix transcriptional regulator
LNETQATVTVTPVDSNATATITASNLPMAEKPRPTSFQLKQQNEAVLDRLVKSGLFRNKAEAVQAALMALFIVNQNRATTPPVEQRPTTAQIAEKFMAENRPLMEDLAAAEGAEKAPGEPSTNLQD